MKPAHLPALLFASSVLLLAPSTASRAMECSAPPPAKLTVNVRDRGAKGDGRTDDTAAIQKAINEVGGTGGAVVVPHGVYMVDAGGPKRLHLQSRMTLRLAPGATLKVIPNAVEHYSLLTITGVSNVHVVGGTLEGDRHHHQSQGGQWGMGITLGEGTEKVVISQVTAKSMWGDGFFIAGAKHVALCSVVADNNRRQGLSIVDGQDVLVTNSVFKNTQGTPPSAGIDLEPFKHEQTIANVRILRSKFLDNAGPGILISASKGAPNISSVEITGNFFRAATPIKIKYAPGVLDSAICKNRYVVRQEESGDLVPVADRAKERTVTAGCGDPGLRKRQ